MLHGSSLEWTECMQSNCVFNVASEQKL